MLHVAALVFAAALYYPRFFSVGEQLLLPAFGAATLLQPAAVIVFFEFKIGYQSTDNVTM
jgi:hypothetical protein